MPNDSRREPCDVEAREHLLKDAEDESGGGEGRFTAPGQSSEDKILWKWQALLSHQPKDRRRLLQQIALLTLLVGFAVVSFGAGYSVFAKPSSSTLPGNGIMHGSNDNDYILDPDWDFTAAPQRREIFWTITDQELNPDGVFRPMITINGQFPGPLIEANEGDTISVTVDNRAVNSTSIHWHGLYQNGTNNMDGTVGVTQCPIAPGTNFTYEFKVARQSGTYWYHAHHGVQASDGLYGPLVIHSKDEQHRQQVDYATDRIVMVSDHYYDLSGSLLYQYFQPDRENAEPVPASALINGRGIRNCEEIPSRACDNTTIEVGNPVLNLETNKNHRLRFINTGAFAEFQIQLDEHEFAVTEADGTDLVPRYYHRLNILPAQRYSIVVTANHTIRPSFWLRARMITHCFAEPNPELSPEVRAIVRYASNDVPLDLELPDSLDWPEVVELQCRDMNSTALEPVVPVPIPARADHTLYIRSNFEIGAWRLSRGYFNNSSWRPNIRSPSLFRIIDGVGAGNQSFINPFAAESSAVPAGINSLAFDANRELVYQTSGISVVDILISNFDDGAHPFHLHGHKFWVLASGQGYPPSHVLNLNYGQASSFSGTDGAGGASSGSSYHVNVKNPLYRDTATVSAFGWALLRFVADNAGVWAFHCHISWHSEAGLLMQFVVRGDEMAGWKVPEHMKKMCGREGVEKGSGPDDSVWFGDYGR